MAFLRQSTVYTAPYRPESLNKVLESNNKGITDWIIACLLRTSTKSIKHISVELLGNLAKDLRFKDN